MRPCKFTVLDRAFDTEARKMVTTEHTGSGTFLGWGIDFCEFETGGASYTAGIIEMGDGKVMLVRADYIQFTDKESA